jgi:membrane-anchored protein YejM (alkaline phosphatase superfamily)
MRVWTNAVLRLCWGTYFILASLYCFLAFVPFTYLFVIVNPPYRWIVVFAHYNVPLLWLAVAASVLTRRHQSISGKARAMIVAEACLALTISILNPIGHIQNSMTALGWSIGFLLPPLSVTAYNFIQRVTAAGTRDRYISVAYSDAIFVGALAGLISVAAPRLNGAIHASFLIIQSYDAELMSWVVVEHLTLAIAIASAINLLKWLMFRYTKNGFLLGPGVVSLVVFIGLTFGCLSFVENSLSLRGWVAWNYSILLAASLTLLGLELLRPVAIGEKMDRWLPTAITVLLIFAAIYVPLAVDQSDDWNGILHQTFALLLWATLAPAICRLRSLQKQYAVGTVLVVAMATCVVYEALIHSRPLWAADIGKNNVQILRELNNYSAQNPSFGIADKMLGNQESRPCDTACKTLRQYSNIRDAVIKDDLNLVDNLTPTSGPKPNIFIFVIDSVRPDYLGAYNPRVDFTPNIDALARDSIVMRRAYTDYAGTSLAEPSIWSGALLLHAHYAQPFKKVNSLEKLARVDGYQMVISYDSVLRQLLAPSDDLVALDTDKRIWGRMEISSTLRQLEDFLNHRPPGASPVFFYAQPMNVHGHADNDLPKRTPLNWQTHLGFDDRIAFTLHQTDEFFGAFIGYLRSKKLYDNCILIVTSDHGDATGELGRTSHSTIIYPEVMRVPLIIHFPEIMRGQYVYDENRISTLTDIAPSLYYLLGHGPIKPNPLAGRPMFVKSMNELQSYPRPDLFLASDSLAAYGILGGDGRWMYTTYDSPSRSMLFDLAKDPTAQNSVLTPAFKKQYDDRILQYLQTISKFYGHHPTGG